MSADDNSEAEAADCCSSCGKAEVDDTKLKQCDGCDLVRYCGDECQANHRPDHEAACKERAAKLRDEILFKQPEGRHLGDCPICCLPHSVHINQSSLHQCCSKIICNGCSHANLNAYLFERGGANIQRTCPFCRQPIPETMEEAVKFLMKRAERNDPVALREFGRGLDGKIGDCDGAFAHFTEAAKLGDVDAHYLLSHLYVKGKGVEKDETKGLYHLEEAAIRGHSYARHNLACWDWENGQHNRAVKHLIIAANLGLDESINGLKEYYKDGLVSKEDFAAALRAHQAAVDATKSPQREVAAKALSRSSNIGVISKEDFAAALRA